jgi:ApaG protein
MPTYSIQISVRNQYVPEESQPEQQRYLFAYTITITNRGDVPTQVISRHWFIADGLGHVEEVQGLGVVGHQPLLEPGQSFEYTSACPLSTPAGSMRGYYFCVAADGRRFEAQIPEFTLAMPRALH